MSTSAPVSDMSESPLRYRLARVVDAGPMATVQIACAGTQPESFLPKLGYWFLRQYYRALLREGHAVAVCAVDQNDRVVGLAAGTLDAAEHMDLFRRYRLRLALAAVPQLVLHPGLLWGMLTRYRTTKDQGAGEEYFVASGARCAYWGMLPQARGGFGAISLFQKWLAVMRALGAGDIFFEVDKINQTSVSSHLLLGAVVERESVTPDGKVRLIMRYPPPDLDDAL
jgi:hypothetical protein